MPAPKVVATLPFSAAATRRRTRTRPLLAARPDEGPSTLSFAEAYATRRAVEPVGNPHGELLEEAEAVARRLGYEVRRRVLGGAGGGARWVRGRLQVVLDADATSRRQLGLLADALRGDPRLAATPMSTELLEYLGPRRAA